MRIIRCSHTWLNPELQKELKNSVVGVTIGNFDGLHLGHQKLFAELDSQLQEISAKTSKPIVKIILSFRPHPRQVLSGISRREALVRVDFFNLTSFRKKTELVSKYGFDYFFPIRFTKEFSKQSPEEFVREYFLKTLNAAVVVVGDDWSFGSSRSGDVNDLLKLGEKYNFVVKIVSAVSNGVSRVSSGRIKNLLSKGDFPAIAQGLNRKFSIVAKVVKGSKRGRDLGFPTANLMLKKQILPPDGVYACFASFLGQKYPAVSNIGVRPTFCETQKVMEVHILDRQQFSLYSRYLEVEFVEKIRDEKKFSSAEELVQAIKVDIEKARGILNLCG